MREILFRGKRIDNDEWVYGSFCMDAVEQKNGMCGVDGFIRLYDFDKGKMQMHEVDRETVGQFTGLTDQYGAKIWEDDIIRYMNDDEISIGVIRFGQYQDFNIGFNIEWLSANAAGYFRRDIRFWMACREITVIGNIHDTPDLTKEVAQ